jgi:signal transduction histidine kinase
MELSLKGNGRSELTAVDADSQYFPVQMSLSSFKTDNNKKPGYVAVLRDISEEKKTERMKNDLVGMLTHDMGNPILSIQKAIELMVNGTLGQLKPSQVEIMDLALTTSNQLLGMVTDFLDIYQNENGQFLLRKLPIDMNQMLQDGINQLKLLALEKQIVVHYTPASAPLMLNGDQTRLMRTIINIMDNAIKFSPEGGRIDVSSTLIKENDEKKAGEMISSTIFHQLEGNQRYLLTTITDHGSGIPKYYQKNIFEKFFTNNPKPNKGRRGLGLGLAFCKLAIEAHEGLIWTKSPLYDDDGEKNKGCRFNFILPTNFAQ